MDANLQTGFSLVEVLVSILVVSIGIIGSSAMELTALRTAQQSGFQTIAHQLAAEISNQIRAAKNDQIRVTEILNTYLSVDYRAEAGSPSTVAQCFSIDSSCQPIDLAKFNISQWENRIKAMLPNGRLVICQDSEPWDNEKGEYKWQCGGPSNNTDKVVVKIGWDLKGMNGDSSSDTERNRPPLIVLVTSI